MWLRYFLCIPKSIYLNFRKLPLRQAVMLPILIYRTKLRHISGDIVIDSDKMKIGLVKIGFGETQTTDIHRERTIIDIRGKVVFRGGCKFGTGSRISVDEDASAEFGSNFNATAQLKLICKKSMTFGKNNLLSWNCLLMDSDQHHIFDKENGEKINDDRPIKIGDNVWIGCDTTILKGTEITDNVIVGAESVVIGKHNESFVAIAGNPAKIVKRNIIWTE